jgi:uncharacterized protein (TIGR00266 family)
MYVETRGGSAFSYLAVTLDPGEVVIAEPNAMTSMAVAIDLRSRLNGGFFKGLLRKFLGGESLFINHFTNLSDQPQTLMLSQASPGQILCRTLKGDALFLQPGAFVACEEGVDLRLHFAGFASWFAREGLFRIKAEGEGTVWFGAYGALLERTLDGELLIDTSHLVAYDPGIRLHVQLAGGVFASLFGGEGFVTRVSGTGRIILQSRSVSSLARWLNPRFW